jgi:hypothetical protein
LRLPSTDFGRLVHCSAAQGEGGGAEVSSFDGTGQIAEMLERRWISVEVNADYVAGSQLRFPHATGRAA